MDKRLAAFPYLDQQAPWKLLLSIERDTTNTKDDEGCRLAAPISDAAADESYSGASVSLAKEARRTYNCT